MTLFALDRFHIPSFSLGFLSCIFLYYLSPGLLLILGGIVRFVQLVLLIVIVGVLMYAVLNITRNDTSGQHNDKHQSVRRSDVGNFRYFNIPINKIDKERDYRQTESRHPINTKLSEYEKTRTGVPTNPMQKITAPTVPSKSTFKKKVNAEDQFTSTLISKDMLDGDKTVRYENFVNMANRS